MSFELFDTLTQKQNIEDTGRCMHLNIVDNCCEDCGVEIDHSIIFNKEWKNNNNRNSSDPSRCLMRKNNEKNIDKDVENLCLPENVIQEANKIYQHVVKNNIYRGNTRKSIIFACIFYAYKQLGQPHSCDALIKLFNLEKRNGLRGLKIVSLNATNKFINKSNYITPEDIIKEIMHDFSANETEINQVIDLYQKLKTKNSDILSRSRPQSIASGIIRYYIIKTHKEISMEDFRDKVNLSELTINKIVKEITKIIEN